MKKRIQKNLGQQLSNPKGFWGIIVGRLMNIINKKMYQAAYELLELKNNENLLEIGFGNGAFIKEISSKIYPGHYFGVDISDAMINSVTKKNKLLIQSGKVSLFKSNANNLPFNNHKFDKILTINTIYFWDNPKQIMEGIKRVLKPEGSFVIALNTKKAMEKSEYVKELFTLYDKEKVKQLFKNSGFKVTRSTYKKMKIEDVLCIEGKLDKN